MIGVVLWSDRTDGKAVFWCEDQGDLAYYEAASGSAEARTVFDAGDMVQFETVTENRVRKANNARLLEERAYVGLPESLKKNGAATAPAGVAKSAKVIPFGQDAAAPSQGQGSTRRKA